MKDIGSIGRFKVLYKQNLGLINSIIAEWLIEISGSYDYDLFRKAIEIATDRSRRNKGYINGILNQWRSNDIFILSNFNAFEVGAKNKEERNGTYRGEYLKYKYA